MEKKRSYLAGYLMGLFVIVISLLVLAVSDAFNDASEKYYMKSFILGTVLFFAGSAILICPGSSRGIDTSPKRLLERLFWNSSILTRTVWVVFIIIGLVFPCYIVITEKLYLTSFFAKGSVIFVCGCLTIKSVICIILNFLDKKKDEESDYIVEEEKDDREPTLLLLGILVLSLLIGFAVFKSISVKDRYKLMSHYKGYEIHEKERIKALFTPEFMEQEIDFSISTDSGSDFSYLINLDSREEKSQVKIQAKKILQNAIAENVMVSIFSKNNYIEFSPEELREFNGMSEIDPELVQPFFTNNIEDKEFMDKLSRALFDSDMYIVVDDAATYNYQYVALWDLPTYCSLTGIDLYADDWEEQFGDTVDCIFQISEFMPFLIQHNPDSKHGCLMNFGGDNSFIISYDVIKSVWEDYKDLYVDSESDEAENQDSEESSNSITSDNLAV